MCRYQAEWRAMQGRSRPDAEWCWSHHPDYEQARQRRASKGGKRGGRGRPQAELSDLKRRISGVIDAVLEGSQDRGRAAVAIQGFNALRAVLEQERKNKELDELMSRLEALEAKIQPTKGARSRGEYEYR
jgi:hypothetical protein